MTTLSDEDLVVSAKLCKNWVESQSEKSAAQRISLLNSSFTTDEGHFSVVEEPQMTFATVMRLDVPPQDIPACWLGRAGGWRVTRVIDKVSTTLLQDSC